MKNTAQQLYEAWMKESDQEASEMLYSVYLHTLREPLEEDIDLDVDDDFDGLQIDLEEEEEEEEDEEDDDDDIDDDFGHLPIGSKTYRPRRR